MKLHTNYCTYVHMYVLMISVCAFMSWFNERHFCFAARLFCVFAAARWWLCKL